MSYVLFAFVVTFGLFLGMLLFLEIGRRIGERWIAKDHDAAKQGLGAVEGAVFGLLGLLIAFTFSGAGVRFDTRRQLIVEETNAIGTAYLRLDMLPASVQPSLREYFRRYLDSRLAIYQKLPDVAAAKEELAKSNDLQTEIWRQAVAAVRAEGAPPAAAVLLLPALNEMFDITTTRTMAIQLHPPAVVFVMLFGLALLASMLAGYGMAGGKARKWLHMFGFALIMSLSAYVILDLEFPRLGLIRVDAFDQALVDLRASMNR
jgi:hypothetical protein